MDLYLSYVEEETKYSNEDRIRILKEVLDQVLTDIKIAKIL
jgi:hypothetical protein